MQLRQVGFDFLFLIEQLFNKDLEETIHGICGRLESQLAKQVALDTWSEAKSLSNSFVPFGGSADFLDGVSVTASAQKFHQSVMSFLEDLESFLTMDVRRSLMNSL